MVLRNLVIRWLDYRRDTQVYQAIERLPIKQFFIYLAIGWISFITAKIKETKLTEIPYMLISNMR